jgi:hypothetical protein
LNCVCVCVCVCACVFGSAKKHEKSAISARTHHKTPHTQTMLEQSSKRNQKTENETIILLV